MRKWKCTVCGYIHEGDEPPEKCPVCGADRSKFVEIFETEEDAEPAAEKGFAAGEASRTLDPAKGPKPAARQIFDTVKALMVRHHAHPILVHIPNGVVPVSFLLCLFSIMLKSDRISGAVEFNLLFVMLSMPLVLFSGYLDWKERYGGALTTVFTVKMACGGVVTLGSAVLYIWLLKNHNILVTPGAWMSFVLTFLVVLAAAGTAGFLGGKLVFKE
jgi:hypothetical protein